MPNRTFFAHVCYSVTRGLHLYISTLNIFINSFDLCFQFLSRSNDQLECFLFFTALLFEVSKLFERFFFVLRLLVLFFELYLG